ncbi:DUF2771 domain-containing protein [Rhodococcus sp. IEGM 1330]|uniref:DUF2771 domain-containing protein n=1 Tax=Rhodococcus sp. IEGM 1330 TaxID=3082225 RepID=UPI0029546FB4|nr:DUF2771 domain-containing protein [Rhodococcus sp. IEGM 1330]MDV8022993.1 DUF2771 domain-containing protein [Rhodococcus sp. IEGM 1330]
MNLAPHTKKIAALTGAGLLVVAVAFVAVLALLIGNAPDKEPTIATYANGRTVEVEPYLYCAVSDPLCTNVGETSEIEVGKASTVQLSLPEAVYSAPWVLALVYGDDAGNVIETSGFNEPGTRLSVTVPTTDDSDRTLLGIEVRLPTGIIDTDTNQEGFVSHAIWSIGTRP